MFAFLKQKGKLYFRIASCCLLHVSYKNDKFGKLPNKFWSEIDRAELKLRTTVNIILQMAKDAFQRTSFSCICDPASRLISFSLSSGRIKCGFHNPLENWIGFEWLFVHYFLKKGLGKSQTLFSHTQCPSIAPAPSALNRDSEWKRRLFYQQTRWKDLAFFQIVNIFPFTDLKRWCLRCHYPTGKSESVETGRMLTKLAIDGAILENRTCYPLSVHAKWKKNGLLWMNECILQTCVCGCVAQAWIRMVVSRWWHANRKTEVVLSGDGIIFEQDVHVVKSTNTFKSMEIP